MYARAIVSRNLRSVSVKSSYFPMAESSAASSTSTGQHKQGGSRLDTRQVSGRGRGGRGRGRHGKPDRKPPSSNLDGAALLTPSSSSLSRALYSGPSSKDAGRDQQHEPKSGRGAGRGGKKNKQQQPNQRKKREGGRQLPPPKQFTSDFASMHAKCQAARYKVHRPGCDCSKMKNIRERLKKNGPNDTSKDLDGLVVLPDIKSIDSFYLCLDTDDEAFGKDSKTAELKLFDELFSVDDTNSEQKNTTSQSYKVSCAQCLLKDEPNGFVCVSSPSVQTVEVARDLARKRARYKTEEDISLHADHAEHVCVLSRIILWQYETSKTRDQTNKAHYALVESLAKQGIEVHESQAKLELGHHLVSLLHITRRDVDANSAYWLVMMQWSGKKWNIDLPGGKRHLGETSFEGATRECGEEISLTIDSSWVQGEPRQSRRKADEGNVYYMLRPSADLMMESLESNAFWHEPGFCKEPLP